MLKHVCLVTCLFAFGCGDDGSGVSSTKTLVSLSDDQRTDVCEYLVDVVGGPRVISCDGEEVELDGASTEQCIDAIEALAEQRPSCVITVGEYETCVEDLADRSDEEICAEVFPTSCDVLVAAAGCGE